MYVFRLIKIAPLPKYKVKLSRVRLLKMFPLFEVLFIATKRVCLQNIELKYQKLPLFWKARKRFSALPFSAVLSFMDKGPISKSIRSQWAAFFIYGSLIEF